MKVIFFIVAWMSFICGVIGAFVPLLPTTPFLILSAFLFSKSSPRFQTWVMKFPLAGEGIKDWQERRIIKTKAKILSTSMIGVSLIVIHLKPTISEFIKWPVTLLLFGVSAFILTRNKN